jgi:hypothetical protein
MVFCIHSYQLSSNASTTGDAMARTFGTSSWIKRRQPPGETECGKELLGCDHLLIGAQLRHGSCRAT